MDKKVSIKNIDKILKNNKYENKTVTYKCGDENIDVEIIPCTDYVEWYGAIETSMGIVFSEDDVYQPAIYSFALDFALISCFTNIKLDNVVKIINLTKGTDIIGKIINTIPEKLYLDFVNDFEKTVEYRASFSSPLGRIASLASIVGTVVKDFTSMSDEELKEFANKIGISANNEETK